MPTLRRALIAESIRYDTGLRKMTSIVNELTKDSVAVKSFPASISVILGFTAEGSSGEIFRWTCSVAGPNGTVNRLEESDEFIGKSGEVDKAMPLTLPFPRSGVFTISLEFNGESVWKRPISVTSASRSPRIQ